MNIHHLEEAKLFLDRVRDVPIIALDTETTPIIPGHVSDICGCSIYYVHPKTGEIVSAYLVLGHKSFHPLLKAPTNIPEDIYPILDEIVGRPDLEVIFQNAIFDLQVLDKVGVHIKGKIHDTMVYSHLVDENRRVGLDKLAIEYFGEGEVQYQEKIKRIARKFDGNYSLIPPEMLGPYAEEDVRLTWMVYEEVKKELVQQELTHLLDDEMDFLRVVRDMRAKGSKVDRQKCLSLARVGRQRLTELQAELGFDPMKPDHLAHNLFAKQPEGLGFRPVSFGKRRSLEFPSGIPLAPRAVLKSFKHPVADMVLEYRGHVKAVSTWFEGFVNLLGPDGRLHPNYHMAPRPDDGTGSTVTGRLSCSEPNLQQIPRRIEEEVDQGISKAMVKQLFIPEPGFDLISFDWSQLELRLAASYGQDPEMVELFRTNGDMHQLTADKVGSDRYSAKVLNFAVLYGAGAQKLGLLLDTSEDEAKEMLQAFWRSFPRLAQTRKEAFNLAFTRKFVRLWTGRRRHFPDSNYAHKAFNSVIQGGGFEIVKHGMLKVSKLPGYGKDFFITNQVHDDVWIEIKAEKREELAPDIRRELEWATFKFIVPFPVDYKVMATSA